MSYVRFSSDNWKSDVYVYESDAGFEVIVAASRHVGDIPPLLDELTEENQRQWFERNSEQMAALEKCELVPIGGPYDGQSFTYGSLQDLYDGLKELQEANYHVPAYVFETIVSEMEEERADQPDSQVEL